MASPDLLAFRRWLRTAKPGADFVYCLDEELRPPDLFQAAYHAYEAGDIALFQSRIDRTRLAYHARKISARAWSLIAACGKRELAGR